MQKCHNMMSPIWMNNKADGTLLHAGINFNKRQLITLMGEIRTVLYNIATGKEIYDLSDHVMKTVYEKFRVRLEREVNMV